MKIVIVTQYFYPEEFKINDLAEELVKLGHDVTVLTGKPNYPGGKILKGYKFWGVQKDNYKGANVIRVPLIPRGNGSGVKLALNYFSYVFFASIYILFHRLNPDKIFCFETSPILQMYPALLLKRKTKVPAVMWVQDLWPESVTAASNLKNGVILRLLTKMVRQIYRHTDKLFIQSPAFRESILDKGQFSDKLVYAPNWAEDIFLQKDSVDKSKYQDLMPEGFKVMFAGNIGVAQDFESIIKAAQYTKDIPQIKWVIVGDGRMRKSSEIVVRNMGLSKTVKFLGRYPVNEMPNFFTHADVMLVTLKDEYIFSLTIPSKVQAYMAFGKPIVTMLSGMGNDVINEAKCGLTANAGDYKTLARNVIALYNASKKDLDEMSVNCNLYYKNNFEKSRVVKTLID